VNVWLNFFAYFHLRLIGPSTTYVRIEDVRPVHVAGYTEQMEASRKAPIVKQHLACIRMLFDWLVTGQVLPPNPACRAWATALRHQGRDHGNVLAGNDTISQKH
jgi:hypothetical protein